jgi:hypothetical protein
VRRIRLLSAALVLLTGLSMPMAAVAAPAAPAADVHGDDERDRYVGSGGLILPGGVDDDTRHEVSRCGGCGWRLTSPCLDAGLGNAFDGQSACLSVVRGCPGLRELLRAWTRPVGGQWHEVGLVCMERTTPITVEQVDRAVAARFSAEVAPLGPAGQPGRGVVTQLPVLFDSGQPAGPQRRVFRVLGESVTLTAWPSWTWDFGDGAAMDTTDPGGRFPHDAVSHVYRRAGEFVVHVDSRWTAEFTVDGLGPFPVSEDLAQRASLQVRVGEGRALLTPR